MVALMSEFGDLLVQARKAKRWSQEELAAKADISGVHVGYLERAKREPSKEIVVTLARALGADVDEFLGAAGFAPITPSSARASSPLAFLNNMGDLTYPPSEHEKKLLADGHEFGVSISTMTEPGFWEQEPGERRSTFLILEQGIEDARRFYRSQGKIGSIPSTMPPFNSSAFFLAMSGVMAGYSPRRTR